MKYKVLAVQVDKGDTVDIPNGAIVAGVLTMPTPTGSLAYYVVYLVSVGEGSEDTEPDAVKEEEGGEKGNVGEEDKGEVPAESNGIRFE